jgi:hypothetical protein
VLTDGKMIMNDKYVRIWKWELNLLGDGIPASLGETDENHE